MPGSAVLGCGLAVPPRLVTNEELAGPLGAAAAALAERTGVRARRWVEPGLGPSDLGREASAAALAAAGLDPEAVDLIVFATMTPDITFPGSACFLQDKLGCRTIGALDVRAQCAGFLYALATGDRFIRAGDARTVLVVGGEVHSTSLELAPRGAGTTPIFGDGAGTVVLGASGTAGVLAVVLHGDPTALERFWCEYPASRQQPERMTVADFRAGGHFMRLEAAALAPQALSALRDVTREALAAAGVAADQVALWLMHYLDPRVALEAAAALELPPARVVATAAAGHVAGGGIPIALAEAVASGRVGRGDVVCASAFGAGMAWGSAVLRL